MSTKYVSYVEDTAYDSTQESTYDLFDSVSSINRDASSRLLLSLRRSDRDFFNFMIDLFEDLEDDSEIAEGGSADGGTGDAKSIL